MFHVDDFDYGPGYTAVDIEELLERSRESERKQLEAELSSIDQQLQSREDLRDQIIDDVESKLDWYVERLDLLQQRSQGKHGEREQVKARIESLYESLRTERRAHWCDRQTLLSDRRDARRELRALEQTDLLDLL